MYILRKNKLNKPIRLEGANPKVELNKFKTHSYFPFLMSETWQSVSARSQGDIIK